MKHTISPDYTTYKRLTKRGNLIPIIKEIILDCETPVSAFLKIPSGVQSAFLLESVEYGEKIGRYSFIGFEPEMVIEKRNDTISMKEKHKSVQHLADKDPLEVMKRVLAQYTFVSFGQLPALSGGFVGYFGYENVATFEDITLDERPSLGFPQAVFFLMKKLIVFDHVEKKVKLVVLSQVNSSHQKAYKRAVKELHSLETILCRSCRVVRGTKRKKSSLKIHSNMSRQQYVNGVKKIKEYIRAGDVIQVVFSQRLGLGNVSNDFTIYRALRTVNPSPYMFYFRHKNVRLIGSSPEVLVKKQGRRVEVRPIAGTRPRGMSEEKDAQLAYELQNDKKELAEHLMLVDLGRNDIGRVCGYATVQVMDYARVERYSHVMHLVSEVHGILQKGKDVYDLLRATFPAGTLTGAPKIRAMEIINELEPSRRGPYGGCLGYFSFSGDCDMCITIRTIMIKDSAAYLQAGAGIVYDSVPQREFQETINKANALIKAVEVAEGKLL